MTLTDEEKKQLEAEIREKIALIPPFEDGRKIGTITLSKQTLEDTLAGKLTFERWASIQNEEVKSAFATILDEAGMLFDFLRGNLTEKDTYVNKRQREDFMEGTTGGENIGVYTRYTGLINELPVTYVRCYCPSTDRMFFLCTENMDTVKDAIASLCEIPSALYDEVEEIYRQGEIFSFKLTKKGEKLVDDGEVDYNDMKIFSGEDYFNKMKYEY